MKAFVHRLALPLTLGLLLAAIACSEKDDCYVLFFSAGPAWDAAHLDNSGSNPAVLAGGEAAPRAAYGIRLSAPVTVRRESGDQTSTTLCRAIDEGFEITSIRVFSQTAFDKLPEGSEVTDRFVARFEPGVVNQHTTYTSLLDAVVVLANPKQSLLDHYHTDLLLLHPPEAGDYQFLVKLNFKDTRVISHGGPPLDTLLVTTPIRLQ